MEGKPWMLAALHTRALAFSSQLTAATSARPCKLLATLTYWGASFLQKPHQGA